MSLRSLLKRGASSSSVEDPKGRVGSLSARDDGEDRRSVDSSVSSPDKRPTTKVGLESLLQEQKDLLEAKLKQLENLHEREREYKQKLEEAQSSGVLNESAAAQSDDDDDDDEILYNANENDSSEDENEEVDADGGDPDRPRVYSLLGTGGSRESFGFSSPESVPSGPHTPRAATMPASVGSAYTTPARAANTAERRMTDCTKPSSSRAKRTVLITRKVPGEPLGFTLRTVAVPASFAQLMETLDKSAMKQSTFIDNLTADSLAYQCGVRRGDQILEVDGEPCENAKHDHIQGLLRRNTGTLRLAVRTTQDFFRALAFEDLLRNQAILQAKRNRLRQLEDEEAVLLRHLREVQVSRAQRAKYAEGLDLCAHDILHDPRLVEDLAFTVQLMQMQWLRERNGEAKPAPAPVLVLAREEDDHGAPPQPPSDSENDSGDDIVSTMV
eukprot:m.32881 g.32881  ORF g.32881 m.32881 type:complete len:442 (-) comp5044_c0_seq2:168-1493(-)